MEFKQLGQTGVRVSSLCLGTMSFGGDAGEAEAAHMYAACRDAGINFFDTADAYNAGESERILGRLAAHEREELVIASKCHQPTADDVNARGSNRRHIVRAVDASLKRLNTDRLDLLLMHRWDPHTPLQETLRALDDLVGAGKVLYLGASNFAAWQVALGLGISQRMGWNRLDVIQPMYSLVKRQAEVEILPLARSERLGVMTYSPVGGGLLSGKYSLESRPGFGRIVDNAEYKIRYGEDWVFATAGNFNEFAADRNVHPVTLAVAWAASHPDVTCPIIGGRDLVQLKPALESLSLDLSAQDRRDLSALSFTPPPATDRLEEIVPA